MEERSRSVTRTDEYVTTLIGYARVSKADGSQVHDLQRDALIGAGVDPDHIYEDAVSGQRDDRPGSRPASRRYARATRSWFGSSTGSAETCATSSTPSAT